MVYYQEEDLRVPQKRLQGDFAQPGKHTPARLGGPRTLHAEAEGSVEGEGCTGLLPERLSQPDMLGSPCSSPRAGLESGGGLRQRPGVTERFVHTCEHLCMCIHLPSEKRAGWRDPERCHSTNAVRATHREARRPL